MIHKRVIGHAKAIQQEDNLSVKVALSEGGASNHLQEVLVGAEFHLAGTKFHHTTR